MPAPSPLLPVISYARISADTSRDEHGVQDQHKINHETAAKHGWHVVAEFTDNDKSAAKARVVRDEFEHMLRALRSGKLDNGKPVEGVVVVADDRLTRRPGDYERFVEAFTHEDGRGYADARGPKDLYSEDVEGMGLFGVVISKMEVRKMQRRMRNSHRSRAERGIPAGGNRPFGWQEDRRSLHPEEAPLLAKAVREYVSGRSMNSIVKEWQKADVKTTLGNAWTTTSLKVTLTNPRLCGWRAIKGQLIRSDGGEPKVGQWDPIVTPEEWLAVKALFDARKGRQYHPDGRVGDVLPANNREPRHLLTGFLRCGKTSDNGTCNSSLRVTHHKHCVQHIYCCPSKTQGGCGGIARRGDKVDEFISEAVLSKLEERALISRSQDPWSGRNELTTKQNKLAELQVRWESDEITDELYWPSAKRLESRIKQLRSEQSKHALKEQLSGQSTTSEVNAIRERWYLPEEEGGLPLSTKRAYIAQVLHAVIIRPAQRGRTKFNPDLLEPVWRE